MHKFLGSALVTLFFAAVVLGQDPSSGPPTRFPV